MQLIRVRDRLNEPRFIALLMPSMFQPTPKRAATKAAAYTQDKGIDAYACRMNGLDVGLIILRMDGNSAEILNISTDTAFRGLNVGRFMIEQTMVQCHLATLDAETDDDAVGFYQRCGFTVERSGDIDGRARYRCRKTFDLS